MQRFPGAVLRRSLLIGCRGMEFRMEGSTWYAGYPPVYMAVTCSYARPVTHKQIKASECWNYHRNRAGRCTPRTCKQYFLSIS